MNDDDIPVLRDAVIVRRQSTRLSPAQIDNLCDSINVAARALIDNLLAEGLRECEAILRAQINDRLSDELPGMIEKTLRDKLG
jgi:hypothetical protein